MLITDSPGHKWLLLGTGLGAFHTLQIHSMVLRTTHCKSHFTDEQTVKGHGLSPTLLVSQISRGRCLWQEVVVSLHLCALPLTAPQLCAFPGKGVCETLQTSSQSHLLGFSNSLLTGLPAPSLAHNCHRELFKTSVSSCTLPRTPNSA